ncbi:hypothetical protein [Paenibacillus marinisediminis]
MSYQPIVKHKRLSEANLDRNMNLGQIVVTLQDGTQLRIINNNGTKSITRLLTKPCPICRKDFFCSCFDSYVESIDEQLEEMDWQKQ